MKNEKMNSEHMKQMMKTLGKDADKLKGIIKSSEKCADQANKVKGNDCEVAGNYGKCMMKEIHKNHSQ